MPAFLFAFIGIKLLVTIGFESWLSIYDTSILKQAYRLWVLLQVEQMAVGAIGAWVLFSHKEKILAIVYHPLSHIISLILLICLFIIPIHHWWINYAEAFIFITVIMNLSTNPAIAFNMENRLMNVMGNVSYGIYMYHTVCITICMYMLRKTGLHNENYFLFNVLLYTLSVALTFLVAYFSYELFEKKFLYLKERFMIVKSGKNEAVTAPQEGGKYTDIITRPSQDNGGAPLSVSR
jgi:peptidoglycan/LPS O-acetylase OafA/YrhL